MIMKSQAQRAYLHANKPGIAREFEKKTPKGKKLPRRVVRSKKRNSDTGTGKIRAPKRDRVRSY